MWFVEISSKKIKSKLTYTFIKTFYLVIILSPFDTNISEPFAVLATFLSSMVHRQSDIFVDF